MHTYVEILVHTYIYTHTLQTKQMGKVLPRSFTPSVSDPDSPLSKAEQTKQRREAGKKGS